MMPEPGLCIYVQCLLTASMESDLKRQHEKLLPRMALHEPSAQHAVSAALLEMTSANGPTSVSQNKIGLPPQCQGQLPAIVSPFG
mmetsp:Transcript_128386/g.209147  ORF Transcript_128386/g.209147 Transcript_128386/m.209147 type:complete len:85 (+) Transcript_128386:96-350(+)